jgi:hypothetical protein
MSVPNKYSVKKEEIFKEDDDEYDSEEETPARKINPQEI